MLRAEHSAASVETSKQYKHSIVHSGVSREGGFGWGSTPPPEIPKALQSRAKLNPIVKTVKNCWI